jgi:uncharacterized protein
MPSVARFNLAPLKSTQLHHPEQITLTPGGAVGDRRFLLLDPEGHRFSGEAKASILGITAVYDEVDDSLTMSFPQGSAVSGPAEPSGQAFTVALYDHETNVRVVQGPFAAAVSAAGRRTCGWAPTGLPAIGCLRVGPCGTRRGGRG